MQFSADAIEFLTDFETHLEQTLGDARGQFANARLLCDAADHLALADAAKRMRPLLVDHIGRALQLKRSDRLAVAAAAELIHTASLLHDDVVDEADVRRGRPAANVRWGNSVAVLSGDLVLCIAFEQLHRFPRQVVDDAVELVATMTRAALHEIVARRSRDWGVDDWETIAEGKTAALMGWCTATPAIVAGREDIADRMRDCGRQLGLAFQLMDDLTELQGGTDDEFIDLHTANPSFPVAVARQDDSTVYQQLDALWSAESAADHRLADIADRIVAGAAPDTTIERIDHHLDRATDALGNLAERPGGRRIGHWCDMLRQLAHANRPTNRRETG